MTKYRPLTTSELTRVLVRFDHIVSLINANHNIMGATAKLWVSDSVAGCV